MMKDLLKFCKLTLAPKYIFSSSVRNNNNYGRRTISTSTSVWSSSPKEESSKYWLLSYKYNPENLVERREPLRPFHLALANDYAAKGKLLFGGAFADPIDGAAIVFKSTKNDVLEFIQKDPYVTKGIVTSHTVREWTVVVGNLLPTPPAKS